MHTLGDKGNKGHHGDTGRVGEPGADGPRGPPGEYNSTVDHRNILLDIFQLHLTLRFVRQRRLTLNFI